jgi:endonuclease/exonuclease/phosphatase family metal-dependent hydrolase
MSVEAISAPSRAGRSGHGHSRPKRKLPLWIAVVLWVVVAALGVVAAMRLVAWDSFDIFVILNSVTAFIYLPAWIVVVVAGVGRRYVLAVAALVIVVLQILFMLPELTAAEPVPAWATTAPAIKLFDANVYAYNHSMAGYATEIEADQPQLLTMEEAVPTLVDQLKASGSLANLPYTVQVKRYDPHAFFIASKYPLTGVSVSYLYGAPLIVKMTMQLPSGPHAVWVVHTTGPTPQSFAQWKGQVADIDQQVRRRGPAGLLLVGDFNSTWGNKGFRQILAAGMTDGAAARARPFQMTWSQTKPIIPPVVRIDHVVTGPGVAVTAIGTDTGPGSDHRDIQATVAFRP